MNRRLFGMLGVTAALVFTVGCKSDPLSDLDGTPAAIIKEFSQMQVAAGASARFVASVVDGRLTPLPETMTFTSTATGVVTVAGDPTYNPQPPTSQRARVTGVSAGSAYIRIQGGGLSDSVRVVVP